MQTKAPAHALTRTRQPDGDVAPTPVIVTDMRQKALENFAGSIAHATNIA